MMIRLLLGLSLASTLDAQAVDMSVLLDSARRELDSAVTRNDAARLGAARALLERVVSMSPRNALAYHYLGYTWYREAIQLTQQQRNAKPALEEARTALEKSIALAPISESHALLSAVFGQMIGSNPFRGMTLGPGSDGQMNEALRLGPGNPRAWMLRGIGALYKPSMFGGGVGKAEADIRRALELFVHDKASPGMPAWGHAEAYAWLGQIQARRKDYAGARASYARSLELEPEFAWVRAVLLPNLEQLARQ